MRKLNIDLVEDKWHWAVINVLRISGLTTFLGLIMFNVVSNWSYHVADCVPFQISCFTMLVTLALSTPPIDGSPFRRPATLTVGIDVFYHISLRDTMCMTTLNLVPDVWWHFNTTTKFDDWVQRLVWLKGTSSRQHVSSPIVKTYSSHLTQWDCNLHIWWLIFRVGIFVQRQG